MSNQGDVDGWWGEGELSLLIDQIVGTCAVLLVQNTEMEVSRSSAAVNMSISVNIHF